jgi:hypothetical protein
MSEVRSRRWWVLVFGAALIAVSVGACWDLGRRSDEGGSPTARAAGDAFDPVRGRVASRRSATALDIEATPERAWVDLADEDTLVGVVTHAPAPDLRAANGGTVFAIALGFGSVWATNYGSDTVTRLDATSGEPIGECTLSRIAP